MGLEHVQGCASRVARRPRPTPRSRQSRARGGASRVDSAVPDTRAVRLGGRRPTRCGEDPQHPVPLLGGAQEGRRGPCNRQRRVQRIGLRWAAGAVQALPVRSHLPGAGDPIRRAGVPHRGRAPESHREPASTPRSLQCSAARPRHGEVGADVSPAWLAPFDAPDACVTNVTLPASRTRTTTASAAPTLVP
jgi:hypothetical protein